MRWWTYQKERFPLAGHAPLVAAFSSCAILYSSYLQPGIPLRWEMFVTAFATCLIFFLQLRIADEFKDYDEDSKFRPYRPVPRGLVSLRELGFVFAIGAAVQLALALWLAPLLCWILFLGWAYLALMCVEFFAREWLKARPITYLWTHMMIMPLVDLYATACYWIHGSMPGGLGWFLAASFTNGLVIEIGRKIRDPKAEETGVPTYSKLWGRSRATLIWRACQLLTLAFAIAAAALIGAAIYVAIPLVLAFVFLRRPSETAAGLWTAVLYLGLGFIPLALL